MIFARAKNKLLWHNNNMKKSWLLLIPALLVLSACQEITVGFLPNDEHSAGFDRSVSSNPYNIGSYSYYRGDTLIDSANGAPLTIANLTFKGISESKTDIKDVDEIFAYFDNDQNILKSVENPAFFSTKKEGFAFLGVESTYAEGKITMNFNAPVYSIVISARAYSYNKESFEETLIVDDDIALSVNDKGFVKLDQNLNEEKNAAVTSTCCFSFNEPVTQVTLRAGKKRAILEKIAVYF